MRTQRLFLLLFISFSVFRAPAQNSNNTFKAPDIIPKSPEAASLGRYGEVQVGEYTGAANISVPLHTVRGGKLEYPINLTYNSTGIRVAQEATWVGLGWDLSALAGITYVPVQGNDQSYTPYTPWSHWESVIDYINPLKVAPIVGNEDAPFWCGGCTSQMGYQDVIGAAQAIGARDLFSVNCMGLSFKFYIDPSTNQAKIFGDKAAYKIEIINGNIYSGFKITDNNGVMYSFRQIEYAHVTTPNGAIQIANLWYVTEIRRPDGDVFTFTYSNFGGTTPIPSLSEQHNILGMVDEFNFKYRTVQSSSTWVENHYLTKIESATEIVQFNLSGGRQDINGTGARKLDGFTVTDKFSGRIKSFSFEYGYFDGMLIGGNYLNDNSVATQGSFTNDNLKKRLKLLSVTEKDQSLNANREYTFSYNEENPLPYKTSFAMDHWGFYNGQENSSALLNNLSGSPGHTLIPQIFSALFYDPDPRVKNQLSGVDQFVGAFRGCHKDYVNTGNLKSITYPTGGRTEFTFEPNSFKNYPILSAQEESQIIQYIADNTFSFNSWDFNNSSEGNSSSFTLSAQTVVNFTGNINNRNNQGGLFNNNQMQGTFITLVSFNSGFPTTSWTISSNDFDQNGNLNKTWTQQLTLPAGTYVLATSLPDNLGFQGYSPLVQANIKYSLKPTEAQVLANHTESIGEGLRIKLIKNYSAGNTLVSAREFKYINTDGTTSGKLLMPLKYSVVNSFLRAPVTLSPGYQGTPCNTEEDNSIVFNSGSQISILTSPLKANVGYDRVEISDRDNEGGNSNGIIIKEFKNNPASHLFFDDIKVSDISPDVLSNGNPALIIYKDGANNTIREEIFSYENSLIEKDWINLKINDRWEPSVLCSCLGQSCEHESRYYIGSYYYARYKNFLTSKVVVDHTPTGNITTQTDYEYNLTNYDISKIKTTDSKGELNVTTIKYADDFKASSSLYSDMVNANMVSLPIETIKYKGETEQLERVTTNYFYVDNFYIEPVSVERQLRANTPATLVVYNQYSAFGNLAEYKAADGIYNSAVWGYNSTLPIAFVENARLANIFHTSFEETDGNSPNNDCKTGLKSHIGAYSKQLTGLDNGAYLLSYWLKSGSNWTLNTQTINVTSGSYTISFTAAQQVDDIRFHPVGSNMKTFTYEPTTGMTSTTDINNRTTYYEYDGFGRLSYIRDKDNNIIKKICYNYAGQSENCPLGIGNAVKNGSFTKNNCSSGTGTTITYTVAANTYFGATQQMLMPLRKMMSIQMAKLMPTKMAVVYLFITTY